ncbi:transcriptional elongation regulator MINIYO isoform X2 [Cannabis sativa]|uniref:transcriptional elongation regulator MINIYO isoform X2 n=1 Tax=Cannabis sativa TaxID=3483 RepID=UPI0029CA6990|nr:transcriptional elongation regulator MINIYO isoform X2 [Cannabis sativa]
MEKKQSTQRNPKISSKTTKTFETGTSGLKVSEDDAAHLIGRIVEKGISDEPRSKPFPPLNPTVLPFPVARHRSHGPHWAPVSGKVNVGYGGLGGEEDKTTMKVDSIAPFADPVKRKTKKDMDFSRWREILPGEKSDMAESELNTLGSGKTENRKKDREAIDTSCSSEDKLHIQDNNKDCIAVTFESEPKPIRVNSQIDAETKGLDNSKVLLERPKRREQKCSTSTIASSGNNLGSEQESMSLESQIDAENRQRLQEMSPDEIAQAQAEIMEKMDPALLKLLKKRGDSKSKKQRSPGLDSAIKVESVNEQKNQDENDMKASSAPVNSMVHEMTKTTSNEIHSGVDNGEAQNPNPTSGGLWNAWSQRVENVREIKFSLEGTVVENDNFHTAETDCVTERDFLRTEGDPGGAGYTIKEAVALTRSVIPGQRALALHLLLAVLDNAIHNINRVHIGCSVRKEDKDERVSDWEAIWAYVLGPEPELVLSMRICLDDNHTSVVVACAKVILRILTCDANENYFSFSEKLTTLKDICTAPVFRSKPQIDVGFLRGGFWKYNAKPSNIVTLDEEIIDDETEGKHTIQDDIVFAGQDFAAGLVRMGVLPRLRYLLESTPTAALEECVISILIAIARHSPTSANTIMKCERLIEAVVHRFTAKENMEIYHSKTKSVTLLKVLAQSDRRICFEFIKNGFFQTMTWHLYQYMPSLDQWVKTGQENCKLLSALMVEQLRFWKICIQHGYCVSYFSDIFPSLCLWLNPPTVEKLIDLDLLSEFASVAANAYLVLKALATRLPNFVSQMNQSNKIHEHADDDMEIWRWSHVGPMIDLAVKWIVLMGNLHHGSHNLHNSSVTSLLWVYSAVMSLLAEVLRKIVPDDIANQTGSGWLVPWLPEFVPRVGLEIIKNKILSFSDAVDTKFGSGLAGEISFVERLCHLRQQNEYETSLASVSCLNGIFKTITTIDKLIQLVDKGEQHSQEYSLSREEDVLKDGLLNRSFVEFRSVQNIFMKLVTSEWQFVQSVETFGRGGPAPGVGVGWGASGGGYWSGIVLLAQADAGFIIDLLASFQIMPINDMLNAEEISYAVQIVNSSLAASLIAGPSDRTVVDKAFKILVHVSVLKCLDRCIRHFVHLNSRSKLFGWEHKEEDYLLFSKILSSHFGNRWLSLKKSKKIKSLSCSTNKNLVKNSGSLSTIYEDSDTSNNIEDCTSLVVEWAHQRLPLPTNWFLSPISTLCESRHCGQQKSSNLENLIQDAGDLLEVAKAGLFLLLGMEVMSSFLPSDAPSPVQSVPLVWKLHCLSVILLVGMGVIEEKKSRDCYEALQDIYGSILDKERLKDAEMIREKDVNLLSESRNTDFLDFLRFHSEIHDSYSTFIETLVDQFSAISYGDLIYGRQVAIYLHRCVETRVRLATWNTLTNARVLELLPPLESCFGEAEGYLHPEEDNDEILAAYVKSWTSGALDKAASRGTVAYTLVLHHLSFFIFHFCAGDKLLLRNKLVRSLLRDFSLKQHHEVIMLNLIRYTKPEMLQNSNVKVSLPLDMEKRFEVLTEACERNSSLLNEVKKLKSLVQNDLL